MSVQLGMRPLSAAERARAFAHTKSNRFSLAPYCDLLREMEGDVAYAIPLAGLTTRTLKVRIGRAAKQLGLQVRCAKLPASATEVIVELVA